MRFAPCTLLPCTDKFRTPFRQGDLRRKRRGGRGLRGRAQALVPTRGAGSGECDTLNCRWLYTRTSWRAWKSRHSQLTHFSPWQCSYEATSASRNMVFGTVWRVLNVLSAFSMECGWCSQLFRQISGTRLRTPSCSAGRHGPAKQGEDHDAEHRASRECVADGSFALEPSCCGRRKSPKTAWTKDASTFRRAFRSLSRCICARFQIETLPPQSARAYGKLIRTKHQVASWHDAGELFTGAFPFDESCTDKSSSPIASKLDQTG